MASKTRDPGRLYVSGVHSSFRYQYTPRNASHFLHFIKEDTGSQKLREAGVECDMCQPGTGLTTGLLDELLLMIDFHV